MRDQLSLLILQVLDACVQHPWLPVLVALGVILFTSAAASRAVRGRLDPLASRCRRCRHRCPPARDGAAEHDHGTCAECGASLSARGAILPGLGPPRWRVAGAWGLVAATTAGALILTDAQTWVQWHRNWAGRVPARVLLEGLQRGDALLTRGAAAALQLGGTSPIAAKDFLEAIRRAPAVKDRNWPAHEVWEYLTCVEAAWRDAAIGGHPVVREAFYGTSSGLPGSPIDWKVPWPTAAAHLVRCGNDVPDRTYFEANRVISYSEHAWSLGDRLERGPWELWLSTTEGRQHELRWQLEEDDLSDLPLDVAGSYRVSIRQGSRVVATGALVVAQLGPSRFCNHGWGLCVQSMLTVPDFAMACAPEPMTLDLEPDPFVPLEVRGYGKLRLDVGELRCDPKPRLNIPLRVRVCGVPADLLRESP